MDDARDLERQIELERALLKAKLAALSDSFSLDTLRQEATARAGTLGTQAVQAATQRLLGGSPSDGPRAQSHASAASPSGDAVSAALQSIVSSLAVAGVNWAVTKLTEPRPAGGDDHADTRGLQEQAQARLAGIRRQSRDVRSRLAGGTEALTEEARARVIEARQRALDAIEGAPEKVRDLGQQGSAFVRRNPMVAGGIAVAIGAAVAGAIWWRRRDDPRSDVFEAADRVFEEELAKALEEARAAAVKDC